jgi:hypothetical protein
VNKKDLTERDSCIRVTTPAVNQAGWDERLVIAIPLVALSLRHSELNLVGIRDSLRSIEDFQ